MLEIKVSVPSDCGNPAQYVAGMLAAIGYAPRVGALPSPDVSAVALGVNNGAGRAPEPALHVSPKGDDSNDGRSPETALQTVQKAVDTANEAPKEPAKRGRKPKDLAPASAAEVSVAQDDAATQAQDKADEQAESQPAEDAPKTQEDVRQAMMAYGGAYGMPALQEDGRAIFEKALGEAPLQPDGTPYKNKMGKDAVDDDGKRYWMLPMVTTPEQCAAAVRYWDNAREVNPFKREPVKAG